MPFWKIDKYIQNLLGPNPFRAHDFIGAKGSNFLTWSCLHHLAEQYGPLFRPTAAFTERKESGRDWYPPNHLRPMVNWKADAEELEELHAWILGPMFQMSSLIIHEKRSHLSQINAIGELCAQFRRGMPAVIRGYGAESVVRIVEQYHRLHPEAAQSPWHPEAFESMGTPEWQQLYVNAEHDGKTGVITLSRESYNADVDAELNRAIDWLKAQGIQRVILTGDFHLSTQLVGADTTHFFPALEDLEKGIALSRDWSGTARRLYAEFATSVGFINGKRCLGGMLELMQHCHYVVALDSADLGLPEVTLPVVPGMEGCHWIFRKTAAEHWPKLLSFLLEGKAVRAADGVGWLLDYAGSTEDAIRVCWAIANGEANIPRRALVETPLKDVTRQLPGLRPAQNANMEAARRAILETIQNACEAPLGDALLIQARLSGNFMTTPSCRTGAIGAAYAKTAL
jgi:enoyl-CoA hydratase/carnithine racemase